MKKYEFTGETRQINIINRTVTLHRIKASVTFGDIKSGDIGGWIEREENLSHDGDAWVFGDARVYSSKHVLLVGPIGSRNDYTTFFRNRNRGISVLCGCFLGEIDKFIEKVIETHGENKYASVYRAAAELAKLQIDLSEMDEEK